MFIKIFEKFIKDLLNNIYLIQNTNNDFIKIIKSSDIKGNQKNINILIGEILKEADMEFLKKQIKNENDLLLIKKYVNKYVMLCILIICSSKYKKLDLFFADLINFTKEQEDYNIKIENIFEINSIVSEISLIFKNVIIYINASEENKRLYYEDKNYLLPIKLVKDYNLESEKNALSSIIFEYVYKKYDKIAIYKIIENSFDEEEFIYIEVSLPSRQILDFSAIENILTKRELDEDLSNEFWQYIIDYNAPKMDESVEDKILRLINSKILVPIVEDFLLYHKDSEIYESSKDNKNIISKDDIKIKYFLSKIKKAEESKDNKDNKIFFQPLNYRNAVLHNEIEDVKIINKTIGKKGGETLEYFDDFAHYKEYPYINFNNFQNEGFSLLLSNTVNLIRSVSFTQNSKYKLQMRVGSENHLINIIGFVILNNNVSKCIKKNQLINISDIEKEKNGLNATISHLNKIFVKNNIINDPVYWIFNTKNDITNIETHSDINNTENYIKHMISILHDKLIKNIHDNIIDVLTISKDIEIQNAMSIWRNIEKEQLEIPIDSEYYENIKETIFYKTSIKIKDEYDTNEDIFYGSTSESIKLKELSDKKEENIFTVSISKTQEESISEDIIKESGICQHNLSWDKLSSFRKKDFSKYIELLYLFIENFVEENIDKDYVCKSCGYLLEIKRFIQDGSFDTATNRFVTFAVAIDIPLEDMPEYYKYKQSIRILDKMVEKIANICNFPSLIGISSTSRTRRKNVVKDTLDIILSNNKILKEEYKERKTKIEKLYHINKDLTELFIFDYDNSILIYSSKDKDYYRNLKHNNIITYMIIIIILQLNENNLSFMFGDKNLCNFKTFDKYGHILFENIKILVDKNNTTNYITKYPLLCYFIYFISCLVTKYNMWLTMDENIEDTKKKSHNVIIHKKIIHTVIDALNSIIENSSKKDSPYIYDSIIVRYINKIKGEYSDHLIIDKLRKSIQDTSLLEKKTFVLTKMAPNKLIKYQPMIFDIAKYDNNKPSKITPKRINYTFPSFNEISNVTNCNNGNFHEWILTTDNSGTIKCKLCNANIYETVYDKKKSESIKNNYKYNSLQNLAKKFCISGSYHNFINDKCSLCNKTINFTYTNDELDTLYKNIVINKNKINNNTLVKPIIYKNINKNIINELNSFYNNDMSIKQWWIDSDLSEKEIYEFQYINDLTSKYNNNKNFISNFFDKIKNIIGNDDNLINNTYIIDHDQYNNKLDKSIIISEKDNKILSKNNHPFFKTNVLYYNKQNKIDIFYDAQSLIFIGYKEANKDFVNVKSNNSLKINLSLFNKFKLLGYNNNNFNLNNLIDNFYDLNITSNINKQSITPHIISDIIRNRIDNLKKVIYQFQRFFTRIKFNYIQTNKKINIDLLNDEISITDIIVSKYINKLKNINIYDSNNKHRFLKHWKAIYNFAFIENLSKINFNIDNILLPNQIDNISIIPNIILYFIISEINKLLDYNPNKTTQTYIIQLFKDIIDLNFDLFNYDHISKNIDIKRFLYAIKTSYFLEELEGLADYTEGIYNEIKEDKVSEPEKIQDINEDDNEESQAIDIDVDLEDVDEPGAEMDYESNYKNYYE